MRGEYKVPGGKLVAVDLEVDGERLGDVSVSGDFFLEPDEALGDINAALVGMPVEAGVEPAQLGVAQKCLKAASSGRLEPGQTAEQCLTADNSGKVEKTRNAASSKAAALCTPAPDFGFTSATALGNAAAGGGLALFEVLFGADLDAAAIDGAATTVSTE